MSFRSGQLVIVGMFGFGIVAAVLGMWYRHQTTRRSLALWGTESALLVARAPHVMALEFDPPLPGAPLPAGDLDSLAGDRRDVSRARGMENVRTAFVEDSTFEWARPVETGGLAWRYALVFSEAGHSAVLLFDPVAGVIGSPGTGRQVSIDPAAGADLRAFFAEQFKPGS